MFRFTQEPSSGSQTLCLAKIVPPAGKYLIARGTTYTHCRLEYAALTLIIFISISTVEPYL